VLLSYCSFVVETVIVYITNICYQNGNEDTRHYRHHWLDSPTWALAFLRSFCQLQYPAVASLDFVTSLYQGGVISPTPSEDTPLS
jgi:hypothetical protein